VTTQTNFTSLQVNWSFVLHSSTCISARSAFKAHVSGNVIPFVVVQCDFDHDSNFNKVTEIFFTTSSWHSKRKHSSIAAITRVYTNQVIINKQTAILPSGGLKKLKNESFATCFDTVRTVPRPLCFCFFLIVFTVTFLPFTQSIWHLENEKMIILLAGEWGATHRFVKPNKRFLKRTVFQ